MAPIPIEALPYFENAIYFPILIQIFEKDLEIIEKEPFKLNGPYIRIIELALNLVRIEYKETNIYFKKNSMKLIKGENDGTFTEYFFIHGGYEDRRRYLNVRLRNRSEELMSVYFAMTGTRNNQLY